MAGEGWAVRASLQGSPFLPCPALACNSGLVQRCHATLVFELLILIQAGEQLAVMEGCQSMVVNLVQLGAPKVACLHYLYQQSTYQDLHG